MNRPDPSVAASPVVRRLVLGTAFLIGLAVALAPRTPAVHAQETKSPPATAPKAQGKTVTITDGRGVEAKIEVKDADKSSA